MRELSFWASAGTGRVFLTYSCIRRLTLSRAAAGSTYGIGRIFSDHFEEGGGLLDVDMGKAKHSFKNLYKSGKEKFTARAKKLDEPAADAIVVS